MDAGNCVRIPLTRGMFATVDAADAGLVSQYKWRASFVASGKAAYAVAHLRGTTRATRKQIAMHNLIAPPPQGLLVDHINRDSLDNRRSNLRHATRQQNVMNRGAYAKSGLPKGVKRSKSGKRWTARIIVNNRDVYLGTFDTLEDASQAYDKAALELFGSFATLNFQPQVTESPRAPSAYPRNYTATTNQIVLDDFINS